MYSKVLQLSRKVRNVFQSLPYFRKSSECIPKILSSFINGMRLQIFSFCILRKVFPESTKHLPDLSKEDLRTEQSIFLHKVFRKVKVQFSRCKRCGLFLIRQEAAYRNGKNWFDEAYNFINSNLDFATAGKKFFEFRKDNSRQTAPLLKNRLVWFIINEWQTTKTKRIPALDLQYGLYFF